MKNIYIVLTDKPSRLFSIDGHLIINTEQLIQPKYYQNIYITSDEEIKEGDWYENNGVIFKADDIFDEGNNPNNSNPRVTDFNKKIILTTDQDLIKDGVQAIDDEFLEWFVKNPSCESVEVQVEVGSLRWSHSKNTYKIIIPNLEIWKDVPDYNGLYQVSNLGNVKSLNYGKIRELKPRLVGYDGNQYLAVNLSKEGIVKSVKVHKLVALCFLNHTSKGYDGLVIDHIDSNKLNNKLNNLKLVTPRFNASKDKQDSSSKFTGVTWHKKSKKWQCQIYDNGKLNHLGLFNTEIEASETYNNYLENMTKEEPKQELHSMDDEVECNMCGNLMSLTEDESIYVCYNSECTSCYEPYEEEFKQEETLEDFIKSIYPSPNGAKIRGIELGAKWQQERSYSEEEVIELLQKAITHQDDGETGSLVTAQGEIRTANFFSWFQKFKKK